MTVRLAFMLAATVLACGAAMAQGTNAPAKATATPSPPPPALKAVVESCSARKFETTVEATVNGTKRSRRVKLCGKEGQSDASWIATLKDAVAKARANMSFSKPMREAIAIAINDEIDRIQAGSAAAAPILSKPVVLTPPATRLPEYSALPPLPAPRPAAVAKPGSRAAAAPLPPRLTLRCAERGEKGEGRACDFLEPATVLTLRADEPLPAGATLRFLRKGDARGEVAVAPMRSGEVRRVRLPAQLCKGVATSRAEIQLLRAGAGGPVLTTFGPFGLRC